MAKAKGEKKPDKFKRCTRPNCRGNCPTCQAKRNGR